MYRWPWQTLLTNRHLYSFCGWHRVTLCEALARLYAFVLIEILFQRCWKLFSTKPPLLTTGWEFFQNLYHLMRQNAPTFVKETFSNKALEHSKVPLYTYTVSTALEQQTIWVEDPDIYTYLHQIYTYILNAEDIKTTYYRVLFNLSFRSPTRRSTCRYYYIYLILYIIYSVVIVTEWKAECLTVSLSIAQWHLCRFYIRTCTHTLSRVPLLLISSAFLIRTYCTTTTTTTAATTILLVWLFWLETHCNLPVFLPIYARTQPPCFVAMV